MSARNAASFSIFGFLLLALPASAPAAAAVSRSPDAAPTGQRSSMAGEWAGTYQYDAPEAGPAVNFTLVAKQGTGARWSGRTSEPNTFGDPSAAELYGNVEGTVDGARIRFTKRYDGTGGQSHAVQYEGVLDGSHGTVQGHWRTRGVTGTFQLRLTP
jgi:hypothetical protein